jgi:hypothetical protein
MQLVQTKTVDYSTVFKKRLYFNSTLALLQNPVNIYIIQNLFLYVSVVDYLF